MRRLVLLGCVVFGQEGLFFGGNDDEDETGYLLPRGRLDTRFTT